MVAQFGSRRADHSFCEMESLDIQLTQRRTTAEDVSITRYRFSVEIIGQMNRRQATAGLEHAANVGQVPGEGGQINRSQCSAAGEHGIRIGKRRCRGKLSCRTDGRHIAATGKHAHHRSGSAGIEVRKIQAGDGGTPREHIAEVFDGLGIETAVK